LVFVGWLFVSGVLVGGVLVSGVLVSGKLLVVSGAVGASSMLVGKLGAPIPEPGALATGALCALEALPAAPVAPPALKPGALLPPLAIAPASPKGVLALPEEKALPPPVPPPSALAGGVAFGGPESESCEPGLCDGRVSSQRGSSSEGSGGGMPCRLTRNALLSQVQGEAVPAGLVVDGVWFPSVAFSLTPGPVPWGTPPRGEGRA